MTQSLSQTSQASNAAQPDSVTSPPYTALNGSTSISEVRNTIASLDNVIARMHDSWAASSIPCEKIIWKRMLDEKKSERERFAQKVCGMIGLE